MQYAADPEKNKKATRKWQASNAEKIATWKTANQNKVREIRNRSMRKWRQANPVKARNAVRKSTYGLTEQDITDLLRIQNHRCKLCECLIHDKHGLKNSSGKAHVDHDHQAGAVRGLLCRSCNLGLGFFERFISMGVTTDALSAYTKQGQ